LQKWAEIWGCVGSSSTASRFSTLGEDAPFRFPEAHQGIPPSKSVVMPPCPFIAGRSGWMRAFSAVLVRSSRCTLQCVLLRPAPKRTDFHLRAKLNRTVGRQVLGFSPWPQKRYTRCPVQSAGEREPRPAAIHAKPAREMAYSFSSPRNLPRSPHFLTEFSPTSARRQTISPALNQFAGFNDGSGGR